MRRLCGIPASEGIAFGEAYVIDRRTIRTPKHHIKPEQVDAEIVRFRDALRQTEQQLKRIEEKLVDVGGKDHLLILQAHQLFLQDERLIDATLQHITRDQINTEWAVTRTVDEIQAIFDKLEDDYFRERRSDVGYVADALLHTLTGGRRLSTEPPADAIVVAHELSPAETARFYRYHIKAFVTNAGGRTSHTSIVARSLAIPAVVGVKNATERVGNDDSLIVDGYRGEVLVNPDDETVRRYQRRIQRRAQHARVLRRERELTAETQDGVRLHLLANIELSDEIPSALAQGSEGIGLYRTEFLFLGRQNLPTEEEHYLDAVQVLELAGDIPVTFRTCDLGGDKMPGNLHQPAETNPALGVKSIRFCLEHRDIFKTQLRGLLRAATQGNLRIMFPMISGLEELRQAKGVLWSCRDELRSEGVSVPKVPVGIMVEMPSAAIIADLLAREADFFAIGTNDLTQYSLAIDRANQQLNYLFRPYHPAILRLIRFTVRAAEEANIPVSVCGEMAGDPLMPLVLLGLGVKELSMNAMAVPRIKQLVRGATSEEARQLASTVLGMKTPQEIESELLFVMEEIFPDVAFGVDSEWDEDTVA